MNYFSPSSCHGALLPSWARIFSLQKENVLSLHILSLLSFLLSILLLGDVTHGGGGSEAEKVLGLVFTIDQLVSSH